MVFKKRDLSNVLILCSAIVLVAVMQVCRFGSFGDNYSVWVFDVGQGDSIFIDADYDVLIDGGPSDAVIEKLTAILPFWQRDIDLIVNTHPHADHLTGLIEVIDRYLISEVWVSGQVYATRFADEFNQVAHSMRQLVWAGLGEELGDDISIEVIWPMSSLDGIALDDPNDGSIVLLVECYDVRILLTGDIGVEQELAIMNQVGDIDVLKVGHQGSATSSHADFLNSTNPEAAIISVGENDYGHPHEEVLDRLDQLGASVYRTDFHGDVRVICSEGGYQIKTY